MSKKRNRGIYKKQLSQKQLNLINAYFGPAHFNKSKALKLAGYKTSSGYGNIFDSPTIQKEILRRQKEIRERYEVDYDKIIGEIAKLAFSNPTDYLMIDEEGYVSIRLDQANLHQLAALGEITIETYMEGKGPNAQEVKRVKVKPWNKLTALETLMKHAGLSKEKTSNAVNINLMDRIDAARKRVARGTEE